MQLNKVKKMILIGLAFIINITISAQIKDIDDDWTFDDPITGYYYKDVYHVLDPFEGIYQFNGVIDGNNVIFTLELQVMTHSSMGEKYWEDLLIGAFSYEVNNEEIINNLDELDVNYANGVRYPIDGNNVYTGPSLGMDVDPNEKWLKISISDGEHPSDSLFIVKKILDSGEEAVEILIYHHIGGTFHENDPIPPPIKYPIGKTMTLIKQP